MVNLKPLQALPWSQLPAQLGLAPRLKPPTRKCLWSLPLSKCAAQPLLAGCRRNYGVWNRNENAAKASSSTLPKPETSVYDLSLALSQRFSNVKAGLRFTQYDANAKPASPETLSKAEIAKRCEISTRDLRTIDLPSNDQTSILIRKSTIIIELLDLRLILRADEMLLVHISGINGYNASSVFCYNLENRLWGAHVSNSTPNQPFELRVLDEALASVTATLQSQYLAARGKLTKAIERLNNEMQDSNGMKVYSELHTALEIVRELASVGQRARHLSTTLEGILNDDEDMAEAYLSDTKAGKPHAAHDHQDVEYLLEAYFKSSEDVAQGVAVLIDDMHRTERTIQSTLSVRRNQLMVLEVKMEIAMVGIATATLLAGLYGMNVINYFEESPWAFGVLSSMCVVSIFFAWKVGARALHRARLSR